MCSCRAAGGMQPSLVIEACVDHEQLHASSQLQPSCKFSSSMIRLVHDRLEAYHEAWHHDLCIKLPRVMHFSHRHDAPTWRQMLSIHLPFSVLRSELHAFRRQQATVGKEPASHSCSVHRCPLIHDAQDHKSSVTQQEQSGQIYTGGPPWEDQGGISPGAVTEVLHISSVHPLMIFLDSSVRR